jgi:hypothetical protein
VKKQIMLLVLGVFVIAMTGCHAAECWRYAWNSRFHPERNAPPAQTVIVEDPCDPCPDSCGGGCSSCGTTNVVPGPMSAH